jgi:hypothetical protein
MVRLGGALDAPTSFGERPDRAAIRRLRAWLATTALPEPPLKLMPGVTADDVALLRQQVRAPSRVGACWVPRPGLPPRSVQVRGRAGRAAPSRGLCGTP